MKFCVVKDTTTIVDGSENPDDMMMQNAVNAGFTLGQVEIITETEYKAREIITPKPPSLEERVMALEIALNLKRV